MNRTEALALIAAERIRQVEKGWTVEHDDGHDDGSLLRVATLYYQNSGASKWKGEPIPPALDDRGVPVGFPWDPEWWKPKTPLRDLVRAGALCVAERERLERKAARLQLTQSYVGHVEQKLQLIAEALMQLELQSETRGVTLS